MRIFSFGGGVQSNAVLVLAAQGLVQYDYFVFSNVGNDSENPATIDYYFDVSIPFAIKHGIKLAEIRRQANNEETLYQRLLRDTRGCRIPVYLQSGAPGNRWCTIEYKIAQVRRFAGRKGNHVVGLGISYDESHRMRDSNHKRFVHEWPLIDLRLSRAQCLQIIHEAGLPVPPKSSCWFCPFHSAAVWMTMRAEQPELFEKAADLEKHLIGVRRGLGKDDVYLTRYLKPLMDAIPDQPSLFEYDDQCGGYCHV